MTPTCSSILKFAAKIRKEQPSIQTALAQAAADMPASVRPVVDHVLGQGGKCLRPMLTLFVSRMQGYRDADIYPLACSVEILHTATLLHDDVLDNADLRRGHTAAHKIFGITQTILAGDALLAHGCDIVSSYGDPRLMNVAAKAIAETAAGEILEIDHQGEIPSDLAIYLNIATGKTAWMIRAACEFGAIKAGADPVNIQAAAEYGLNLGIAFQIVDDALDFNSSKKTGKPEGGDLREGKCTPPILFFYESLAPAQKKDFASKFKTHAFTDDQILSLAESIRSGGFAEKARNLADTYLDRAHAALEKFAMNLPVSDEQETLAAFINHIRNRDS